MKYPVSATLRITETKRLLTIGSAALMVSLTSCSGGGERSAPSDSTTGALSATSAVPDSILNSVVTAGKVTASSFVSAGWRTFRANRPDNSSHILVAFHLDPALTAASFAAKLDSFPGTPAGAVALGGPEGTTDEVLLRLPAGRIIVACVSRGADGHRHAISGELAEVDVGPAVVTSIADSTPADSTVFDIPMSDFAFTGADEIPASTRFLRIRNRGQQDHQLRITCLKPGKTISDWTNNPDGASEPDVDFGMARIGSPHDASLPVSLRPGNYVFYCLITDPRSKMQHVELGMMKQISVIP